MDLAPVHERVMRLLHIWARYGYKTSISNPGIKSSKVYNYFIARKHII